MPAQRSGLIAVAAATATTFTFTSPRRFVAVAVVFYDTNGAALAASTGTRDITVSANSAAGTDKLTMEIEGASASAQPERKYQPLDLGFECASISIACAAATNPGSATHYRIWVES
jgi:hypothetical protein